MSLLNYQTLFVKTEPIKSAIDIKIITYSYKEKNYLNASDEHLQYLKCLNPCTNITYKFDGEKVLNLYVCITREEKLSDEWKEHVATLGASCYNKISHFDQPLNIYLQKFENTREMISGIVLAFYKYSFLNKKPSSRQEISLISEFDDIVKIYNAQNFVRFLGDTPANLMTPSLFTEYAKQYCNGMDLQIFDKTYMKENKMNLLLGVAQGSNEEPKLLRISYKGKSDNSIDVSLVGKGVTFDTGGISIKPSANMSAMKGDMLGAASVLATVKLANDLNLKINIEAVLPLTENMPGGRATKPGDVHVDMSGLSVEVDNTDAEGRLILGDAITFAQKSNPKYLFDIATLTGAMSIALGDEFIGYFCNDENLNKVICEASNNSGDLAWRMPLSTLYLSSMKSNVADLKNAGGRKGGSCTAAIFLNEFVDANVKWSHFDIAGVDFDHRNKTLYGQGMTGRGLPLLFELVRLLVNKEI